MKFEDLRDMYSETQLIEGERSLQISFPTFERCERTSQTGLF